MKSRREIVPDNSSIHVYFRCHNQDHLLRPDVLKNKFIRLFARYKQRYGVKIFDFIIMDNHVHLFMWTPNAMALGNFMRSALSQQAYVVNLLHNRDSQVFRSRYHSPMIQSRRYGLNLIKYIYGNRIKTGGISPDKDPFCSAYWRLNNPYQLIDHPQTEDDVVNNELACLIDDYVDEAISKYAAKEDFLKRMIEAAIRDAKLLKDFGLFQSTHTIGTLQDIQVRKKALRVSRAKSSANVDPGDRSTE